MMGTWHFLALFPFYLRTLVQTCIFLLSRIALTHCSLTISYALVGYGRNLMARKTKTAVEKAVEVLTVTYAMLIEARDAAKGAMQTFGKLLFLAERQGITKGVKIIDYLKDTLHVDDHGLSPASCMDAYNVFKKLQAENVPLATIEAGKIANLKQAIGRVGAIEDKTERHKTAVRMAKDAARFTVSTFREKLADGTYGDAVRPPKDTPKAKAKAKDKVSAFIPKAKSGSIDFKVFTAVVKKVVSAMTQPQVEALHKLTGDLVTARAKVEAAKAAEAAKEDGASDTVVAETKASKMRQVKARTESAKAKPVKKAKKVA